LIGTRLGGIHTRVDSPVVSDRAFYSADVGKYDFDLCGASRLVDDDPVTFFQVVVDEQ